MSFAKLPHELLTTKLLAQEKYRKHFYTLIEKMVNIKNIDNTHFEILQSGKLLASLLFYILVNDSFLFIVKFKLLHFTDNATILLQDPDPFIDIVLVKSFYTISWF